MIIKTTMQKHIENLEKSYALLTVMNSDFSEIMLSAIDNAKCYLEDEKQFTCAFAEWYNKYGMRTETTECNLEQFLNQLSNEQ